MTKVKTDAVPVEKLEGPDAARRKMAIALLGALGGAALLEGCTVEQGSSEELALTGEAAQTLTGTSIAWADTVLGAVPPAVRTGDLATKNSVAIGNATLVIAKGCVSIGDGGGGVFYWEPGATSGDDGGTIIVPQPTPAGRWVRLYTGAKNIKWFGARGNGTGDDSAALIAAFASVPITGNVIGNAIYFPTGTYYVAQNFHINKPNVKLFGDGRGRTKVIDLRNTVSNPPPGTLTPGDGLFTWLPTQNVPPNGPEICDMTIDGGWRASQGYPVGVLNRKCTLVSGYNDTYLHDLEVLGFQSEVLYVDGDSRRTRIERNYVNNNNSNAININSGQFASELSYVTDNVIANFTDSAIQVASQSAIVARNHIRTGVGQNAGGDVIRCDVCLHVLIEDNVIVNCDLKKNGLYNFDVSVIALYGIPSQNSVVRGNVIGQNFGLFNGASGAPILVNFELQTASGGNILIADNQLYENGLTGNGSPSRGVLVKGLYSGRLVIVGNSFTAGPTGNMTTAIKIASGVPSSNNIEIGDNHFASDITVRHDLPAAPFVLQRSPPRRYGATAARPSIASTDVGATYFDTTLHELISWDGASWRNGVGTAV